MASKKNVQQSVPTPEQPDQAQNKSDKYAKVRSVLASFVKDDHAKNGFLVARMAVGPEFAERHGIPVDASYNGKTPDVCVIVNSRSQILPKGDPVDGKPLYGRGALEGSQVNISFYKDVPLKIAYVDKNNALVRMDGKIYPEELDAAHQEALEVILEDKVARNRAEHERSDPDVPADVKVLDRDFALQHPDIEHLRVPDTVERIEDDAFRGMAKLRTVSISDGVKSIGDRAFEGCESLMAVSGGRGLESVGDAAFRFTGSLPEENMTEHFKDACKGFGTFDFSKGKDRDVQYLSDTGAVASRLTLDMDAWDNLSAKAPDERIAAMKFPEGMTLLDVTALEGRDDVRAVRFPTSMEYIEAGSFKDCRNLGSVLYEIKSPDEKYAPAEVPLEAGERERVTNQPTSLRDVYSIDSRGRERVASGVSASAFPGCPVDKDARMTYVDFAMNERRGQLDASHMALVLERSDADRYESAGASVDFTDSIMSARRAAVVSLEASEKQYYMRRSDTSDYQARFEDMSAKRAGLDEANVQAMAGMAKGLMTDKSVGILLSDETFRKTLEAFLDEGGQGRLTEIYRADLERADVFLRDRGVEAGLYDQRSPSELYMAMRAEPDALPIAPRMGESYDYYPERVHAMVVDVGPDPEIFGDEGYSYGGEDYDGFEEDEYEAFSQDDGDERPEDWYVPSYDRKGPESGETYIFKDGASQADFEAAEAHVRKAFDLILSAQGEDVPDMGAAKGFADTFGRYQAGNIVALAGMEAGMFSPEAKDALTMDTGFREFVYGVATEGYPSAQQYAVAHGFGQFWNDDSVQELLMPRDDGPYRKYSVTEVVTDMLAQADSVPSKLLRETVYDGFDMSEAYYMDASKAGKDLEFAKGPSEPVQEQPAKPERRLPEQPSGTRDRSSEYDIFGLGD